MSRIKFSCATRGLGEKAIFQGSLAPSEAERVPVPCRQIISGHRFTFIETKKQSRQSPGFGWAILPNSGALEAVLPPQQMGGGKIRNSVLLGR